MVLTVPLLLAMRHTWAGARITLVAESAPATFLNGCPVVDEVITWKPVSRGHDTVVAQFHAWKFARRHLHRHQFDLAVLPRRDIENGTARFMASASGARVIVGFSPLDRPNLPKELAEIDLLSVAVPSGQAPVHEVEHGRRLRAALGLSIAASLEKEPGTSVLSDGDERNALRMLQSIVDLKCPLIGVCLGAGHPKRQWAPESFAAALNALSAGRDVKVAMLGGPGDITLAREFLRLLSPNIALVDAVGRTDLRTSLAILRHSDLYLGGDTGTMHMACSVGTPCVVLSSHSEAGSPTSTHSPERFGPWAPGSQYLRPIKPIGNCTTECVGSVAHCIDTIAVDRVVSAITSVLVDERRESLA